LASELPPRYPRTSRSLFRNLFKISFQSFFQLPFVSVHLLLLFFSPDSSRRLTVSTFSNQSFMTTCDISRGNGRVSGNRVNCNGQSTTDLAQPLTIHGVGTNSIRILGEANASRILDGTTITSSRTIIILDGTTVRIRAIGSIVLSATDPIYAGIDYSGDSRFILAGTDASGGVTVTVASFQRAWPPVKMEIVLQLQ
jgi:hypothetical protein